MGESLDAVGGAIDLVAAVLQGSGEGFSYRAIIVNDKNVHAHGLTSSIGGCAVGSASERGSGSGPAVGVGSAAAWGLAAEAGASSGVAEPSEVLVSSSADLDFRARRLSSARCRAAFARSSLSWAARVAAATFARPSKRGLCGAGAVSGVTERWERTRTPLTSRVNQRTRPRPIT